MSEAPWAPGLHPTGVCRYFFLDCDLSSPSLRHGFNVNMYTRGTSCGGFVETVLQKGLRSGERLPRPVVPRRVAWLPRPACGYTCSGVPAGACARSHPCPEPPALEPARALRGAGLRRPEQVTIWPWTSSSDPRPARVFLSREPGAGAGGPCGLGRQIRDRFREEEPGSDLDMWLVLPRRMEESLREDWGRRVGTAWRPEGPGGG